MILDIWSVSLTYSQGDSRAAFDWSPCDPAVIQDPTISCSFFEIPLDYHDLHAGTGRIAVAKVNATGERLGAVFINPGISDGLEVARNHESNH